MNRTACLLAFCAAALPALAQQPAQERWDVPLDRKDWQLIAENREGRRTERIYVPPGESEYFWTEQIVVGHQRLAFAPDDYLTGLIEDIDGRCRPYKMKPIEQGPTNVLIQWEGNCRVIGPHFEFRRVTVAKDGIHFIAYAAKPNRLSEPRKEAWLAIIRGATLK